MPRTTDPTRPCAQPPEPRLRGALAVALGGVLLSPSAATAAGLPVELAALVAVLGLTSVVVGRLVGRSSGVVAAVVTVALALGLVAARQLVGDGPGRACDDCRPGPVNAEEGLWP